jgi:hypothetical protein
VNRRTIAIGAVVLAALGGVAFIAGHAGPTAAAPRAAETPRPLAWLRDASGSVLVGGTSGGTAASSRTAMAERYQLATEVGARAVVDLRLAGTLVVGSKAALQVLAEDWDGPRLRPTRVRFLRGTLRAEASTGVDGLQIDVGDRTVEIAPGGSAILSWDDETLALSMLKAGGILRGRDGKETVLASGQGVRLEPGAGATKPVELPGPLVGSADVRPKIFAKSGKARPTFRFASDQGSVQVVVARDAKLTQVVAEAVADASGVRVEEGLEPGNYYWSASRVDVVSKMAGPPTAPRPLQILNGTGAAAADEIPESLVVVGGESTRVFFSGNEPPALGLDWIGVTDEDTGYSVLVAGNSAFKKPLVKKVVEESRLALGSLPPGGYFWKVKGPDGKTQSGSFVVKKASGLPSRSKRTSQVGEEFNSARVIFQREPPAVEFDWKADSRAASYRMIVSRDKAFATSLLTRDVAKDSTVVEPGVLPEGELYWRVQRIKADGSVYYPGKIQTLVVKFDLENPNLELAEPAEGAVAAGDHVQVSGLAPRDAALWVNGVAVAPDRRGKFTVPAAIDTAHPLVVVKTARAGKDFSYFVRTLKSAH